MTDLDVTADLARYGAANLARTLESGPDLGPGYRRAAANTIRDLEERARTATRRETATRGWGASFINSDAWRNRDGYITRTPCIVGGPLEERAAIGTDDLGALAELPPAPPMFAPIAARCDIRPAAPGNATTIRWSGPVRPRPVPEGDLKPDAGLTPAITPVILPFIAYWCGVTRQVLADHSQLAAIIDGRLRRGLGMSIDDQIATALADDDDITEASDGDLGAAIRVAVGQLAAAGYFGDTTVLISPEDLPAAGILGDLPLLGVTAVIPSAGLPAGTAITADLRAAVQVRYHGTARLSTTDSHAGQFLANEITLLAEQRALGAVADPAAAVKATAGATRTAGKRTKG